VSHGKTTPGVRKILQSQKTFSNHLADFEALSALAGPNTTTASAPVSVAPTPTTRGSPVPAVAQPPPKRSHKKKDPNAAAATPLRKVSTPGAVSTPIGSADQVDTQMGDALALANEQQDFAPHPGDRDPLLKSRIPPMPTAAEIAELLAQPPLTYREARATLEEQDSRPGGVRYPPRHFCEICGYWGKVRCTRCGTRVCALECLRTHGEDCYQRYGA
jgi:zinc finger HIT domain-containing protein 1